MTEMVWGYLREVWEEYKVALPVYLGIEDHMHALITGASGSGKSQAVLFLLGKLLQAAPDTVIWFCDFKNSNDFSFLREAGYPYYFAGKASYDGVMGYCKTFSEAREHGESSKRFLLICDEYPALINFFQMQDKMNKTHLANDLLGAVAEILMLGRGVNFGIWIVTQVASASLFSNGNRENFHIILGLGRLSKEQKSMLFSGEDIPNRVWSKGEGMLLADGYDIVDVKLPLVEDVEDWKSHILKLLMRNGGARTEHDA